MKLYIFLIVLFSTLPFCSKSNELKINLDPRPLSHLVSAMDLMCKRPEVAQMEERVGTQFTALMQLLMNYAGFCYTIYNQQWQKNISDIKNTDSNDKATMEINLNKLDTLKKDYQALAHKVEGSVKVLCSRFDQHFIYPES